MKIAILFLLTALGSASRLTTETSANSPDESSACDCSKPYTAADHAADWCFEGYEDKEATMRIVNNCTQIGCSLDEYKAKCGCDGFESVCKPPPVPAKPSGAHDEILHSVEPVANPTEANSPEL